MGSDLAGPGFPASHSSVRPDSEFASRVRTIAHVFLRRDEHGLGGLQNPVAELFPKAIPLRNKEATMLIGYARVSKQHEQDTTAQVQALTRDRAHLPGACLRGPLGPT